MRLLEVGIKNFKSLRDVTFRPGDLNVLIGPNGAGKSNLADALDFIGEMYRSGLEKAVVSHGGYENVAHRQSRRSKAPLSFHVKASLRREDMHRHWRNVPSANLPVEMIFDHKISFQSTDQGVRSAFRVVGESASYDVRSSENGETTTLFKIVRQVDGVKEGFLGDGIVALDESYRGLGVPRPEEYPEDTFLPTESFLRFFELALSSAIPSREEIGSIALHQVSIWRCRDTGVPSPNVRLGRYGEQLPAVIDVLKRQNPTAFHSILNTLSTIMPTLRDIEVTVTPQRTLGLAFREAGFGRPWTVDNVSDGTIRALGLLTAVFDPTHKVLVIEEPENNLHPWAIGQFIEACRLASKTKQVILTTHSPVVVDQLKPGEVWVVSKPGAETQINRLVDLDPVAQTGWDAGDFTISEFLDSGVVPGTVPAL